MNSLSKIVLPVDFSERSLAAARYAEPLARRFGSELILLHVLTPPQFEFGAIEIGGSMLSELYQGRARQAGDDLEVFLAAELEGVNVRRVVKEGDPAGEIVALAAAARAGLVIMPTHGYGTFRRFILGSNTAKVLHDAECPVWTGVHMEQAPGPPYAIRHVLCAVDLGPQSAAALAWAAMLAGEFGARLTLFHALAGSGGGESGAGETPGLRQGAEWELQRLLDSAGVRAGLAAVAGEPAQAICAAAAGLGADLLVIGRGSAAGVFGRLRTNAYAIIRQSPCPVVSV